MIKTHTPHDIQIILSSHIKKKRKENKYTLDGLSKHSGAPMSTIRKFEKTGQISLRQFIILYISLFSIEDISTLINKKENKSPKNISEVNKID